MEPAIDVNMELILVPTNVIAAMQTTAIRASSKPYSANVAPSSCRVTYFLMNFVAEVMNFVM